MLRSHECHYGPLRIVYKLAALLIPIVVAGHIEVDNRLAVLDNRALSITRVEHDNEVELADMEEVDDRGQLVLGHLWTQHERLEVEPV